MPGKINILIADPVNLTGISFLKKYKFNIDINHCLSDEEITELSRKNNIRILVVNSRRNISRGFLSRNSYQAIATASKGTDHINTEYAEKRNIKIINSVSGNSLSAAEHTLAMILAVYKNLFTADKIVRHGNFNSRKFKSRNLSGKKIGIIGFGQIGSRVAHIAENFGMEVIFNDIDANVIRKNKRFEFSDINSIFRNCDIVTVHIPLNIKNLNFIRKGHLSLMKPGTVFINTSRGAVINEKELLEFLKHRPDVAAGLDVFCCEPNINPRFKSLKNAILSNHIAGKTEESAEFISAEIFKQVNKLFF
jgi:D-3-phosphoglycerate dehydrogenase / 2-oxoglutarate reductase